MKKNALDFLGDNPEETAKTILCFTAIIAFMMGIIFYAFVPQNIDNSIDNTRVVNEGYNQTFINNTYVSTEPVIEVAPLVKAEPRQGYNIWYCQNYFEDPGNSACISYTKHDGTVESCGDC